MGVWCEQQQENGLANRGLDAGARARHHGGRIRAQPSLWQKGGRISGRATFARLSTTAVSYRGYRNQLLHRGAGEGGSGRFAVLKSSGEPESLPKERHSRWATPTTGCVGIVFPDGILSKPAAWDIRWRVMREALELASVELPATAFIEEVNVSIPSSLLFLRRRGQEKRRAEARGSRER